MSEIVPVAECRISDVTRHSQDERVIQMWIHGRSAHTQDAYTRDIQRFLQFVDGKPLSSVTLQDLQAFADALAQENLAPATRHRRLSAVKSLLAFAHRIGYLPFDVGRPLRLPPRKNTLPERILTENETHRMIALEPNRRNRALLMLLYGAGLRVAEACNLRWRDLQARADGGQVTVFGKGGKTRTVLLPRAVWQEPTAIRNGAEPDAPVFVSRKRCALTTRQAERTYGSSPNARASRGQYLLTGYGTRTPVTHWSGGNRRTGSANTGARQHSHDRQVSARQTARLLQQVSATMSERGRMIPMDAVCEILECERATVYELIRLGEVDAYTDGTRLLVDALSLVRYVERHTGTPQRAMRLVLELPPEGEEEPF